MVWSGLALPWREATEGTPIDTPAMHGMGSLAKAPVAGTSPLLSPTVLDGQGLAKSPVAGRWSGQWCDQKDLRDRPV